MKTNSETCLSSVSSLLYWWWQGSMRRKKMILIKGLPKCSFTYYSVPSRFSGTFSNSPTALIVSLLVSLHQLIMYFTLPQFSVLTSGLFLGMLSHVLLSYFIRKGKLALTKLQRWDFSISNKSCISPRLINKLVHNRRKSFQSFHTAHPVCYSKHWVVAAISFLSVPLL